MIGATTCTLALAGRGLIVATTHFTSADHAAGGDSVEQLTRFGMATLAD